MAPVDCKPNTEAVRKRALLALRKAFKVTSPGTDLDAQGYAASYTDNLVSSVTTADFEADLRQGSGKELVDKFRAVHSSAALAVNCFGPFKRSLSDLQICDSDSFTSLHFEKKCPTELRGMPPNLDVMIERPDHVVAIESKCTEYLRPHTARFSASYETKILDARRESSWFREMLRLKKEPKAYRWLDAAQLIKHALGLIYCYPDRPVTLLYLYWEPLNAVDHPLFKEHLDETAAFTEQIDGCDLTFEAMTYNDLWSSWDETAPESRSAATGPPRSAKASPIGTKPSCLDCMAHSLTPPEQDQTSGWGQSPAPAPRVPAHGAPCFALPSLA